MKPNSPGPQRSISKRRTMFLVVLFPIFGVGVHVFAPTFNGLKLSGLPAGYWIAAQLGPVLLALILVCLPARKVAP